LYSTVAAPFRVGSIRVAYPQDALRLCFKTPFPFRYHGREKKFRAGQNTCTFGKMNLKREERPFQVHFFEHSSKRYDLNPDYWFIAEFA
jgi:hypothetical protein